MFFDNENRKKLVIKNRSRVKQLIDNNKTCLIVLSIYNASLSSVVARIINGMERLVGRIPVNHTTGVYNYEEYRILEISEGDEVRPMSILRYFSQKFKGTIYVHIIKANLTIQKRHAIKEHALTVASSPDLEYSSKHAIGSFTNTNDDDDIDTGKYIYCSLYWAGVVKKYSELSFSKELGKYTPAELLKLLRKDCNKPLVKTIKFKQ